MKGKINKEQRGSKTLYFFNGELYRTSKNDYRYACIAIWKDGYEKVLSLGNKPDSTLNSYGRFYKDRCTLEVVEISTNNA